MKNQVAELEKARMMMTEEGIEMIKVDMLKLVRVVQRIRKEMNADEKGGRRRMKRDLIGIERIVTEIGIRIEIAIEKDQIAIEKDPIGTTETKVGVTKKDIETEMTMTGKKGDIEMTRRKIKDTGMIEKGVTDTMAKRKETGGNIGIGRIEMTDVAVKVKKVNPEITGMMTEMKDTEIVTRREKEVKDIKMTTGTNIGIKMKDIEE